jgi:hypothetical protein
MLSIRNNIAITLQGEINIDTPVGKIDILTDKLIIGVSEGNSWKSALGRILANGYFYKNHHKVLWLFKYRPNITIENILASNHVQLRWVGMKDEFIKPFIYYDTTFDIVINNKENINIQSETIESMNNKLDDVLYELKVLRENTSNKIIKRLI